MGTFPESGTVILGLVAVVGSRQCTEWAFMSMEFIDVGLGANDSAVYCEEQFNWSIQL